MRPSSAVFELSRMLKSYTVDCLGAERAPDCSPTCLFATFYLHRLLHSAVILSLLS
jgi:hypothetical protein